MNPNKIIASFAPGTWIESWPYKINLSNYPRMVDHLNVMAEAELHPEWVEWLNGYFVTRDRKLQWRYDYIHALGNDAFMEIDNDAPDGWILFATDSELALFILSHS
jgi:hypothetical protein